jgi:hypothetical protein
MKIYKKYTTILLLSFAFIIGGCGSYNLAKHTVQPSDTINGISFTWTIGAMVELATYNSMTPPN